MAPRKNKTESDKIFKVYELKIINSDAEYFKRLFLEAKWFSNHIIASEDIFNFDSKPNTVIVKTPHGEDHRNLIHLSSQMKQQLLYQIQNDIKALSAKKKKGTKVGKLKFKKSVDSIPFSNQTFTLEGKKVKLQSRKKRFHFRGVKQLGEGADVRCGKLLRKASGIYLHVTIAEERKPKKQTQGNVGVDFGIKDHFTFSDGSKVNFDGLEHFDRIRKAHKNLSRKVKGSRNWIKAKCLLNRAYEGLDNVKEDARNKLIAALSEYRVVFQDEMLSGWQKGLFGKRVQNAILGRVKAALKRNPANLMIARECPTTQACRECGLLLRLRLGEETYECECGYRCDRDVHAAMNMLWFGGLEAKHDVLLRYKTGPERANVEGVLDLQAILNRVQCKHLSVKHEAA